MNIFWKLVSVFAFIPLASGACSMENIPATPKNRVLGGWINIFTDFKIPCNGWITAWRYYAYAEGVFYASVWEDLGNCMFRNIGFNKITVPGEGSHIFRVHQDLLIQVSTSHVVGVFHHNASAPRSLYLEAHKSPQPGIVLSYTCSGEVFHDGVVASDVVALYPDGAPYRAPAFHPFIEDNIPKASATIFVSNTYDNKSGDSLVQLPDILDDNESTCSSIASEALRISIRLYTGMRGTTLITLVMKNTACVPPDGVRVLLAECDEVESCRFESMCYPMVGATEGHCTFHCVWNHHLMGNTLLIHKDSNATLQLCEMLF